MAGPFYPKDGEWQTLEQALWAHTVAELKSLATALPGRPRIGGAKGERIEGLCRRMTGESLRDLWSRLTEHQQAAVAQAVYTVDASFSPAGFKIRHGEAADFGAQSRRPAGLGKPSLLCFFIHGLHVPLDLRRLLLEIVPRPSAPEIPTVEEVPPKIVTVVPPYHAGNRKTSAVKRRVPVHRSDGEHRAVAELAGILRLVEAGRIRVTPRTREVSAPSRRLIADILEGGDFFAEGRWRTVRSELAVEPRKTAIRTSAWPLLLAHGGLIRPRKDRMSLTAAGKKALRSPPAIVLRNLWQAWRDTAGFDELVRVDELRGLSSASCELSDPPLRRAAIARALAQCPPGKWIALDAFFDQIRAAGHNFQITSTPWELYLEEFFERLPLDVFGDEDQWVLLQGRYVLCLLFEVVATLGMIDVAYTSPVCARLLFDQMDVDYISRCDGLRYFRLTALGLHCLGLAPSHEAESPSIRGLLRVTADLKITALRELPRSSVVLLDLYARGVSDGLWRLERPSLLKAIESGHGTAELRDVLCAHSARPLPRKVEKFLDDCETRARSLELSGTGQLLQCPDARMAKRIASDRRTGKHCLLAGERSLAVPDRSVTAFRRALRQLGYGWPALRESRNRD